MSVGFITIDQTYQRYEGSIGAHSLVPVGNERVGTQPLVADLELVCDQFKIMNPTCSHPFPTGKDAFS